MTDKPVILMDVFEPKAIETPLKKHCEVVRHNLVDLHKGDYYWENKFGEFIVERKQPGEALSEIGGQLDEQLRKYRTSSTRHVTVIIEGVASAKASNQTQLWAPTKNGKWIYPSKTLYQPYARLLSYLAALRYYGIFTLSTTNEIGTAYALASLVMGSQEDHTDVLDHYPTPQFRADRRVSVLLGIKGLGEKRAIALVNKFGSVAALCNATIEEMCEVDGVGKGTAKLVREVLNACES